MPELKRGGSSNWIIELESHRRFVIGSITLLCFAILLVSSLRNPVDYDSY